MAVRSNFLTCVLAPSPYASLRRCLVLLLREKEPEARREATRQSVAGSRDMVRGRG